MNRSLRIEVFAPFSGTPCGRLCIGFASLALLLPQAATYAADAAAAVPSGPLKLDTVPGARFDLGGVPGDRVKGNVDAWLTVAPRNNPGLLDMFAQRDAGKTPDLMPWAGEFVGKYLISGVQALRMSEDPALKATLEGVVRRLCELQDEDGYLGPWPRDQRLRGQWDLWGHYHVLLGLWMWYEETGDERAKAAAEKIGDLVCNTFLDKPLRVFDAGSHEMNMGILHGLALLYRETGRTRYLAMAREVLKDLERAGDYYRTGLAGREFCRTPRPRWESLHAIQGLAELYHVTGDASFREAFLQQWASIRQFDMRSTGGFSSGEQATGNPFRNDAIETCCVIAWQAVSLDALRLTGDSTIADDLELATFNAVFGSQHPSGAWCTYSTPLDGIRQPSHIQIAFQIRPGTPHLNCCSVNGPRGYGMISEWGVMQSESGLVLNYLAPMRAEVSLPGGGPVTLRVETDYPLSGDIRVAVDPKAACRFPLSLRIPAWSGKASVEVQGQSVGGVQPGRYAVVDRVWNPGDTIQLRLDLTPRYEAGDLEQAGKAAVYRGPLLMAADSRFTKDDLAVVDTARLAEAIPIPVADAAASARASKPWLVLDVPTTQGKMLRLIDFASAGAATVEGQPQSTYRSFLPAAPLRPAVPVAYRPANKTECGGGPIRFTWRGSTTLPGEQRTYTIVIAPSPDFAQPVATCQGPADSSLVVPAQTVAKLQPHTPYFWKVVAANQYGRSESIAPFKRFTVDPTKPPQYDGTLGRPADKLVVAAALQGDVQPQCGRLQQARGWKACAGPKGEPNGAVELDGRQGILTFAIDEFPAADYSATIWVCVTQLPEGRLGQVFSAWCRGMDDPLRLVVWQGKLHARLEAGQFFGTEGDPVELGKWRHVAGVKQGAELTLYVDGVARSKATVPAAVGSAAASLGVGGNPLYDAAPEFLAARVADFRFFARALTAEELRALHVAGAGKVAP